MPHIAVSLSGRLEGRAIELDGDAAPEQVDGHHEQSLLGIHPDHNALDIGERSPRDPHALSFTQVGVRKHRQSRPDESLNRLDLGVGDGGQLVPPLTEHSHQAPRLADFDVSGLVDRVPEKEVSAEQRQARETPDAAAPAPRLDRGKEQLESLRGELVVHELLAVAVCPEDTPAMDHDAGQRFWQGFAPFGLIPFRDTRPTMTSCAARAENPARTPRPAPASTHLSWRQSLETKCLLLFRLDDALEV